MQNAVVDKKAQLLFEKYWDSEYVCNSQRDIEQIRNRANTMGLFTSIAAFGLNEVARLTMRSPMFKLRVQNVAFWAIAPTLIWQYSYNQSIDERIDNLWRIHKNREEKGLGGTGQKSGIYLDEHNAESSNTINNGLAIRMDSLTNGIVPHQYLDNPFIRWNEQIDKQGFLFDTQMDDQPVYEYKKFERLRHLEPDPKKTMGVSPVVPREDNDEKLIWYDVQGESLYSNPPDPNIPQYDHKLDEDHIWSFRRSSYNQCQVRNDIALDFSNYIVKNQVPWWGRKLTTPAGYEPESMARFFKQWGYKTNLELIKAQHALILAYASNPSDRKLRQSMKEEIGSAIEDAYNKDEDDQFMKNVYTTDHVPKPKKYNTLNDKEDKQFYEHLKRIQNYNQKAQVTQRVDQFESGRYERGSLSQKIFEPLAGAKKLENGTRFFEVVDQDLSMELDEATLKAQFERVKDIGEQNDAEDEEALRTALVESLSTEETEAWNAILDRELGKFASGEEYDFVKDMRRSYAEGLSTSEAYKIFKTIPDHAFWDIKKPLINNEENVPVNPYNAARSPYNHDFFDTRGQEQWMRDRKDQRHLKETITKHRRY